jgi:hypothetical protein
MIVSEKYKFIYISNPKTGTVAAQELLLKVDSFAQQNNITLSSGEFVHINEHSTPREIYSLLPQKYKTYKKIVFVRSPYDKVVSSYFFLKNGNPLTKGSIWKYNSSMKIFFSAVVVRISQFSTYLIPFKIWALLRPVRKNSEYLLNGKNQFIVNYVGNTASLEKDIYSILIMFGARKESFVHAQRVNTSSHNASDSYFGSGLFRRLFQFKYNREIKLFEYVTSKGCTHDFYAECFDLD